MNDTIVMVDKEARLKNRNNINTRGRRGCSQELKNQLVTMYNRGDEIQDIIKQLNISRPTLYKIIKERTL